MLTRVRQVGNSPKVAVRVQLWGVAVSRVHRDLMDHQLAQWSPWSGDLSKLPLSPGLA